MLATPACYSEKHLVVRRGKALPKTDRAQPAILFCQNAFPKNKCMDITLRPATPADRQFVEAVYFKTQRWLLEKLYGWDGDDHESAKFADFYCEASTKIILADGEQAGWVTVLRGRKTANVQCLFLRPEYQNRGIGTHVLQNIIEQVASEGLRLTIGTHQINPAKRLYARLGFLPFLETQDRIEFAYPQNPE